MSETRFQKYARLAIQNGVHLQKGQTLLISASVEALDFTREVVRQAYEAGAKEVIVTYQDDILSKYNYLYQSKETLQEIHDWQIESSLDYLQEGACRLSIISPLPGILKDCDPDKMSIRQRALGPRMREVREYTMASKVQWSVVAVPNEAWAKQVFPEMTSSDAMDKLWETIYSCVYVDEQKDPVQTWEERDSFFQEHLEKMNAFAFQTLHFTNSLGTDLHVGLVQEHIWAGGSELGQNGVVFNANIPTEEIFTTPDRERVNGIVFASRPLLYNGNLIRDFHLTFQNGKVIEFDAAEGKEVLAQLLQVDEGSTRLGEVALVPNDSPISESGILFYTTLFDENASCHLALGEAYPSCIKNGLNMKDKQLLEAGCNQSMVHVDFMFGNADMKIIGEKKDGTLVPVFEQGKFVI